jgi:hypothetical protein
VSIVTTLVMVAAAAAPSTADRAAGQPARTVGVPLSGAQAQALQRAMAANPRRTPAEAQRLAGLDVVDTPGGRIGVTPAGYGRTTVDLGCALVELWARSDGQYDLRLLFTNNFVPMDIHVALFTDAWPTSDVQIFNVHENPLQLRSFRFKGNLLFPSFLWIGSKTTAAGFGRAGLNPKEPTCFFAVGAPWNSPEPDPGQEGAPPPYS